MGLFGGKKLGKDGEDAAAAFLRTAGFRIIARNFNCPLGELDLICQQGDSLIFVEVKCRRDDGAGDPENNITPGKQRRLRRAAEYWIAAHGTPNMSYRFDAVSVIIPSQGTPRIRHIIEAFVPRN